MKIASFFIFFISFVSHAANDDKYFDYFWSVILKNTEKLLFSLTLVNPLNIPGSLSKNFVKKEWVQRVFKSLKFYHFHEFCFQQSIFLSI